jgi:hypothetical protein
MQVFTRNFIIFISLFASIFLHGQKSTYVDDYGVFRYSKNDKEILLFGVNYTLPFAHGYRAINYVGKNHKEAIDKDVYHLARLGLDGFRVHIWDGEITDSIGNLINSQQLDLLDYTLAKMKERGIKTIITPFKVGGNGYPERSFPTAGFSSTLEKWQTYSGEEILKKQERYFTQLLNHINPYTGIAYKNDPDIVALEINNEPRHDRGEIARAYINKMVAVIRKAGFKNPIFYNVSERPEFIDAYLKADIQGCTFQWYPTGLVHNSLLQGNYLPNVDRYNIPFSDKKAFQNKTRIIYEFDVGDTNQSTLYPAMARSFRQAKFQFAAQFAYDPIDLAYANTEYQTHYLNLAYSPSKAISLKIASEVFHEVKNDDNFGIYPENTNFRNTTLIPDQDLAIYNSETKFYYTNSTEIQPKKTQNIKHIAGVGNSEIIKYSGNGAYFLDKVENGIWRLEVLPDVLWVNDPFEKASLKKTAAVLEENEQNIEINVSDLNTDFEITPINNRNKYLSKVTDQKFLIVPGTYLLHNNKILNGFKFDQKIGNIKLNEFATTKQEIHQTYVVHKPIESIENNKDLLIEAQIVSPNDIEKVEVVLPSGYQKTDTYTMVKNGFFSFKTTIPKEKINNESFKYYIVVYTKNGTTTFPENLKGDPAEWDFIGKKMYETSVVQKEPIIVLFDAVERKNNFLWPNQWNAIKYKIESISYKNPSKKELRISTDNLIAKRNDVTFKILVGNIIQRESKQLENMNSMLISASSGLKKTQKVQIALQLKNGKVFGKTIILASQKKEIIIPFSELVEVPLVLLPRPYPGFQPYFFQSKSKEKFNASEIEAVQISIGPGIDKEYFNNPQEVLIDKIQLQ